MTQPLTAFAHRLIAVAGAALVLQFFSEFYFLNEYPAVAAARGLAALPEMGVLAAWYMLFAYAFLIVLDRFEVRTWAGLLLAGSLFGWATEALLVPVVYEFPPVSFIWPSVSWHALVDVMLGWCLIRLAMRRLAWPWLALVFASLGIVWAFWASWTWGAEDEAPLVFSTGEFWTIVLMSGASWITGTLLADAGARRSFRASRWEIGIVCLVTLALFGVTGWPWLPWPAALALVVALTFGALAWAKRGRIARPDLLAPLAAGPPLGAYLVMPLLPVSAGLTYPIVLDHDLRFPTEEVIPLLVVLGALGFVWALVRAALDGRAT